MNCNFRFKDEFSIENLKYDSNENSKIRKINKIIKNALNEGWTVTKKKDINSHKYKFELSRKIKNLC